MLKNASMDRLCGQAMADDWHECNCSGAVLCYADGAQVNIP